MKLQKFACTLALVALLSPLVSAQADLTKKPTDDPETLRKDAVAFLRETMADVNNLRTLENRISFSAELAGLMWFHDEREARSLYLTAVGNFRELLMRYDQQMNSFPETDGPDVPYRGGPFAEVTDRGRVQRRFQTAMMVRQQIAMSLAEHDPELAFGFYYDSLSAVTNPAFRQQMEGRDEYFEGQLLSQIAKADAGKAAQLGAKSVANSLNYQHLDLLRKIYEKDPEKGAEFAASILSKLRSETITADKLWIAGQFLDTAGASYEASKTEGGKRAMLSQPELRDLADSMGLAILSMDEESGGGVQYLSQIEKYSPSRAVQIRARFKSLSGGKTTTSTRVTNTSGNVSRAMGSAANSNAVAERERLEREKTEKELATNVEKLGDKQLPKEEREKIIAHARRILVQTPGRDKKIMGLSALASQVAKAGDKELAAELMKDAQALVNPHPKNFQDFLLTWMLASGYAEAEPEKAFPLLEDTILRANDTISAFIKVGEFIDVAGEMIDEGEVQVGAFGGNMIRGLTSELGMADSTLRKLAKADFRKTRDLTSRFDRSEVRILAKMMILRAVLGEKQKPATNAAEALPIGN